MSQPYQPMGWAGWYMGIPMADSLGAPINSWDAAKDAPWDEPSQLMGYPMSWLDG